MSANFTSGWLGNNEAAWHNQGVVEAGTRPARQAFEIAEALFSVEKRELQYPVYGFDQISIKPSGSFGVVRTDTQALLGVVSNQYEIVQNEALLRMAEFIREEVDMDSVIVLGDGVKVCFTATLKGAAQDIVPGDTVKRRIVGYLGHDGKTGCGAMFTNIRVVCQNTLTAAMQDASAKTSITHKGNANANFDKLIQSINVARQTFAEECDLMREFAQHQFYLDDFRNFVSDVYKVKTEDINSGKFRKMAKLQRAYHGGLGARDFAPFTLWSAVNAVTEVETSTKVGTAKQRQAKFKSANFGQGALYAQKAVKVAKELVTA